MTGKITSEICIELLIFGVINCVLHVNTDADYKTLASFPFHEVCSKIPL